MHIVLYDIIIKKVKYDYKFILKYFWCMKYSQIHYTH